MSDEVFANGVRIGRVVLASVAMPDPPAKGRATLSLRFQPDHVGMMHAAARELDKG